MMISFSGKSEVFFAQVGGSVTLPYEGHTEKESVYVRWYFCSNEQEDLLIWKHPKQDSPKNGTVEGASGISACCYCALHF